MFFIQKLTTTGLKLAETISLLGHISVAFCDTPCHDHIRSDRVPMERACVLCLKNHQTRGAWHRKKRDYKNNRKRRKKGTLTYEDTHRTLPGCGKKTPNVWGNCTVPSPVVIKNFRMHPHAKARCNTSGSHLCSNTSMVGTAGEWLRTGRGGGSPQKMGVPHEGGNGISIWGEHCPLVFYWLLDADNGQLVAHTMMSFDGSLWR